MGIVAQVLEHTGLRLAEIAARVGYKSEFIFSRTFARGRGLSLARFRNRATPLDMKLLRESVKDSTKAVPSPPPFSGCPPLLGDNGQPVNGVAVRPRRYLLFLQSTFFLQSMRMDR
jgi:hypothetical protein